MTFRELYHVNMDWMPDTELTVMLSDPDLNIKQGTRANIENIRRKYDDLDVAYFEMSESSVILWLHA